MHIKLGIAALTLTAVLGGCGNKDDKAAATDDFSELAALEAAEKADQFSDRWRLLGTLSYGQTSAPVSYVNPPRYRAFKFAGAAGDAIDVWVRSQNGGDAVAWVLDSSFRILGVNDDASGSTLDAHVVTTLTANSRPSNTTYYVVLRDYDLDRATFKVTLARQAPPQMPDASIPDAAPDAAPDSAVPAVCPPLSPEAPPSTDPGQRISGLALSPDGHIVAVGDTATRALWVRRFDAELRVIWTRVTQPPSSTLTPAPFHSGVAAVATCDAVTVVQNRGDDDGSNGTIRRYRPDGSELGFPAGEFPPNPSNFSAAITALPLAGGDLAVIGRHIPLGQSAPQAFTGRVDGVTGARRWGDSRELGFDSRARDLALTAAGDLVMAYDRFWGSNPINGFLVRFSAAGVAQPQQALGVGRLYAIAVQPDGRVLVASDSSPPRLRLIDTPGAELWSRTIADAVELDDVAIDAAGDIYVGGKDAAGAFVRRYDPSATTERWTWHPAATLIRSLLLANGHVYAAGETATTAFIDRRPLN